MSFNPKSGLVYIPVIDAAMVYVDTSKRRAGLIGGISILAFFLPEDYNPKELDGLYGPLPSLEALSRVNRLPSRAASFGFEPALEELLGTADAKVYGTGEFCRRRQPRRSGDSAVSSTCMRPTREGSQTARCRDIDYGRSNDYEVKGAQYISVMAG